MKNYIPDDRVPQDGFTRPFEQVQAEFDELRAELGPLKPVGRCVITGLEDEE